MLANTGAYVLDSRIFEYPSVPAEEGSKEFGLPQTIVTMVQAGDKFKIVPATWWKNVTSPEDLLSLMA
jgi:dTDP-glucose pyrophosphorylase